MRTLEFRVLPAPDATDITELLCSLVEELLDRSPFEPDPLVEDCVERLDLRLVGCRARRATRCSTTRSPRRAERPSRWFAGAALFPLLPGPDTMDS